jgi:hypothetical protein
LGKDIKGILGIGKEGGLIAAVLMTTCVGLFGTFIAYLGSWFIQGVKYDKLE